MKLKIEYKKIDDLIPYINNSRTHSADQVQQIASSIKEFGWTNPLLLDGENGIIAGHGRLQAARLLGEKEVPTIQLDGLTEMQKKAYIIADNKLALNAGWDNELLGIEITDLKEFGFNLDLLGFSEDELKEFEFDNDYVDTSEPNSMEKNFGQPPFSVLDTRKGSWQDRKREWRLQIGDNGESRENALSGSDDSLLSDINNGVSILDPVMAEIVVKWFGMENGLAFDPFAGDSVFGFVAGSCGMGFKGIELRKEQADLNQKRVTDANLPAQYFCDSGENMDKYIKDETVDLVFSCPPYADLEVYSNDPRDLSNMSHDNFFKVYKNILQNTFKKLKNNRFAVIVMGEVRGKDGNYIGTIPNTIKIMEEAGYNFYNEIVIINPAGTLPLRAGKSMRATRKVGKMHQNVLVFLKGNANLAVKDLGVIDMKLDFEEEENNE
jgi:DNA modification methylase